MASTRQRSHIGRLGEIAQVAARHGFGYLIDGRRRGDGADGMPTARGRHLREMLDELGPTFVKFGQLLSTRPDIVPPDIIAELRALQDDVRGIFELTRLARAMSIHPTRQEALASWR